MNEFFNIYLNPNYWRTHLLKGKLISYYILILFNSSQNGNDETLESKVNLESNQIELNPNPSFNLILFFKRIEFE